VVDREAEVFFKEKNMFTAALIQIIVMLVIVGLALWVVSVLPIDPAIKQIIRVIVIVVICIWLLYFLVGILPSSGAWSLYRR
jgi:uncharacterized protein (DUF983 family)